MNSKIYHESILALKWWAVITVPLLLMLTVLMPPGFYGIPWMLLVLLVFLVLFAVLVGKVPTVWINGVVPLGFWCAGILPLCLIYPGTESTTQDTIRGAIQIISIGLAHATIQMLVCSLLLFLRNRQRSNSSTE